MLMQKEREQIAAYGKKVSRTGLCPGTSGNLSIFDPETGYVAISPSGMDYEDITPEDVVVTDLNANRVEGDRKPSSEWALHTAFYKSKPHARAVVHTHSLYCTTFAVLHMPLKAVHYMIAGAGVNEIPCAAYKTFGTTELAQAAMDACGDSNAVLLGNHGIVVCGTSLADAYALAVNCEYIAGLQYRAMCVGTPVILDEKQMADALVRFQTYGQQPEKT